MTKKRASKSLTYDEFFAAHKDEIDAEPDRVNDWPPPLPPEYLINELRTIWELRTAALAAKYDCPEAFAFLIRRFLKKYLATEPPEGAFMQFRQSPRGRKQSAESSAIWLRWLILDRPSVHGTVLAESYCASEYRKADEDGKKRIRDRLRRAVERMGNRLARPPKKTK